MAHLASMNCRAVILWSTNADIWRPQIVIPGSRDMHCRVNTALTRQYPPITGHLNCVSYPQSNMSETLSVTSKRLQEHDWVRGLATCQAIMRSDKHHNYCQCSALTLLWGKRLIKSMTEALKFRDQYHCHDSDMLTSTKKLSFCLCFCFVLFLSFCFNF